MSDSLRYLFPTLYTLSLHKHPQTLTIRRINRLLTFLKRCLKRQTTLRIEKETRHNPIQSFQSLTTVDSAKSEVRAQIADRAIQEVGEELTQRGLVGRCL